MPHRPHLGLRQLSASLATKTGLSHNNTPKPSPAPGPTAGIAWIVLGASNHPAEQDELNNVVSDLLAPDLLKVAGITLLWRLCNTSPSAGSGTAQTNFMPINGGCCALVIAIHDISSPDAMSTLRHLPINIEPSLLSLAPPTPTDSPDERKDSGQTIDYGADLKRYALIQRYEGRSHPSTHGTCVVAVGIEPADASDHTLDSWYRDEHLDLLAQNPIFIRCTRYKLLSPQNGREQEIGKGAPRFLALHEYTSHQALLDYAIEHGSLAPETVRSKEIFASAKSVERTIWEVSEMYDRSNWTCGKAGG